MRCERCGNEYRVTVEDERLIRIGDLAPVCPQCVALSPFAPKRPHAEPEPKNIGYDGTERLPGRIFRVQAREPSYEGRINYMEIERSPQRHVGNVVQEKRKGDLRVLPIRLRNSVGIRNQTPSRIHTNLMGVMATRRTLWFKKEPAFVDKYTGLTKIEIPFRDIVAVRFEPGVQPSNRFAPYDSYVRVETRTGEILVTLERSPRRRVEARRQETSEDRDRLW